MKKRRKPKPRSRTIVVQDQGQPSTSLRILPKLVVPKDVRLVRFTGFWDSKQ